MAVVFCQEITGREGSKDVDTNDKRRRTWIARTDRPQDGSSVLLAPSPVLAAAFVPNLNDIYQYLDDSNPLSTTTITDSDVVCVDKQVIQDNPNDPQDWRIVCQYMGVADPTAQPAEVEYSPTRYQKALVKDLDGKQVVNAAKDPFESGITVDRTRFTLTLVKAVLTWDPVAALAYQDSVNQFTFLGAVHPPGFAAQTCKLTWGAKRVRRKGTNSFYWLRTSVIDIDREGWKVKVRNAGLNELVYSGPTITGKQRIAFKGVAVSSPYPLDSNGVRLAPNAAVPDPLEFKGYEIKDWSGLGLEY